MGETTTAIGSPEAAKFLRFRACGLVEAERSGIPHCKHYLLRALNGWTLADLESAAGGSSLQGRATE
jgi:hypothetical protein